MHRKMFIILAIKECVYDEEEKYGEKQEEDKCRIILLTSLL